MHVRNAALAEENLFLNALMEHSPIAIVALDSKHNVQSCNPAFERLFQYTCSELMEGSLERMIAKRDKVREAVAIWQKVISGEKVLRCSKRMRKDGSLVDVEIHGVPLIIRGRLQRVYGIYRDISEQKEAETELRRLSGSLLRLQDEERRRIARSLHETTAQTLVALTMNLEELRTRIGRTRPDLANLMADTTALAEQSVREIRTVSHLLHPPLLEDVGLGSAVKYYVRGFRQRSGIRATSRISGQPKRISPEIETALFRILQEGLTNIHRHSGSSVANIQLRYNSDRVVLQIRDRGCGMPAGPRRRASMSEGVGLLGIRERVKQLNGQLEILSRTSGTVLSVRLPISASQRG